MFTHRHGRVTSGQRLRFGVFDKAKTAVIHVLRGRSREENEAVRAFCRPLALEAEFAVNKPLAQ